MGSLIRNIGIGVGVAAGLAISGIAIRNALQHDEPVAEPEADPIEQAIRSRLPGLDDDAYLSLVVAAGARGPNLRLVDDVVNGYAAIRDSRFGGEMTQAQIARHVEHVIDIANEASIPQVLRDAYEGRIPQPLAASPTTIQSALEGVTVLDGLLADTRHTTDDLFEVYEATARSEGRVTLTQAAQLYRQVAELPGAHAKMTTSPRSISVVARLVGDMVTPPYRPQLNDQLRPTFDALDAIFPGDQTLHEVFDPLDEIITGEEPSKRVLAPAREVAAEWEPRGASAEAMAHETAVRLYYQRFVDGGSGGTYLGEPPQHSGELTNWRD